MEYSDEFRPSTVWYGNSGGGTGDSTLASIESMPSVDAELTRGEIQLCTRLATRLAMVIHSVWPAQSKTQTLTIPAPFAEKLRRRAARTATMDRAAAERTRTITHDDIHALTTVGSEKASRGRSQSVSMDRDEIYAEQARRASDLKRLCNARRVVHRTTMAMLHKSIDIIYDEAVMANISCVVAETCTSVLQYCRRGQMGSEEPKTFEALMNRLELTVEWIPATVNNMNKESDTMAMYYAGRNVIKIDAVIYVGELE